MTKVALAIDGVLIGHHTNEVARTGCTVVLFPDGAVASGEVRGGAPATREFALLDPTKTVTHIDAVVLSGGSAFGLAACDGVMRWCGEHDRGFVTAGGRVPIVVGLSLFDLMQGDGSVRPTADDGYRAAHDAARLVSTGAVGAAAGATLGKWRGADHVRAGGLGIATVRRGELIVTAIIAVNAVGDLDDRWAAAAIIDGSFVWPEPPAQLGDVPGADGTNTTIGVIVTNALIDKVGCHLLAQSGHDGLARALFPAHTRSDGDALVAVAVPSTPQRELLAAELDVARILATVAVEQAVRSVA